MAQSTLLPPASISSDVELKPSWKITNRSQPSEINLVFISLIAVVTSVLVKIADALPVVIVVFVYYR